MAWQCTGIIPRSINYETDARPLKFFPILRNAANEFVAKDLLKQFQTSVLSVNALLGVVIVPAGVVGNIVGGIVVYQFKWSSIGMLRFAACCMLLVGLLGPQFMLYCDNKNVSGVTVPYR